MNTNTSSLHRLHQNRNRCTRNDWDDYAPHRKRISELLDEASHNNEARLCVLGAGNGNDLELESLVNRYSEITLVDLDREAMEHCVQPLSESVRNRVIVKSGIDLSGIASMLDSVSESTQVPVEKLVELRDRARALTEFPPLGTFDVVISTCLLSQILDSVALSIGSDHSDAIDLMIAVRDGHLDRMAALTRTGGSCILVTDFVSSDTLPELNKVSENELDSLVTESLKKRNFFTGLNPAVLLQRIANHEKTDRRTIRPTPAWRWTMGPKCYAVCAIRWRVF